jgi:hypothetical protein
MAWDFLVELEADRRTDPARPVLFIAHSLGGIFVKEALRRSASCQLDKPLRAIFDATIGIIFFGTPHGGADPLGFLHRVAKEAARAAGFSVNEQVVNSLLPSAERLRELRDEFNPVVRRQNWTIHSFQEAVGVKSLGGEKVCRNSIRFSPLLTVPGCRGHIVLPQPPRNRDDTTYLEEPHGYVPFYGTQRCRVQKGWRRP